MTKPSCGRARHASVAFFLALAACSGGGTSAERQPALVLSTESVSFLAEEGGVDPQAQAFTVANGGGGELAVPTVLVAYGAGTDWLAASVTGGRAPFAVTLQPTAGNLPAGTYAATVFVRSNGASNTPRSVAVTLEVAAGTPRPAVQLSNPSISFEARSYGVAPAPQLVTVTNGGAGTLARPTSRITYEGSQAGWLAAEVTGEGPSYAVALVPSIESLEAGTYRAAVLVESAGASNAASIDVVLTLTPTWTILVYGNADNALSTSLVSAIGDMSAASLDADLTVVVAADFSAGRTLPGGETHGSGTYWFRILGGGATPDVVAYDPTEANFDDPAVLEATVANALVAFPADHVALVLWGPGASWRGFGGDEHDTPGDASDDGAQMSPAQLAIALSNALMAVGRTRIDLVGFDGAPMMSQEVAFELRDVADAFVASADLDSAASWDWATTLGRLAANPAVSAADLALGEVREWDARHGVSALDLLSRAHAALDLSKLQAYADAWQALAAAMLQSPTPDWLDVARRQFDASPGYAADAPRAADPWPALRDAGQLLEALAWAPNDPAIAAAAGDARLALDALVLGNALGGARVAASQVGVHLEASLGARWLEADRYALLAWDASTGWGDVLSTLAANVDPFPLEIVALAQNTTTPSPETPPTIRVSSTDADIAAARLFVGRQQGAQLLSYGVVAEALAAPGEEHDLVWRGTIPRLRVGTSASPLFLQPWLRFGSGAAFLVPVEISDGTSTVEASAIAVDGAPTVSEIAIRSSRGLGVLPLGAFRGLQLRPLLRDETTSTWVRSSVSLTIPDAPDASLVFERVPAPAGTYRLTTIATDVWGGEPASATHGVTLTAPFGS